MENFRKFNKKLVFLTIDEINEHPEHVAKMFKEWMQLYERFVKLDFFIEKSTRFNDLSEHLKELRLRQLYAQTEYLDVLMEIIIDATKFEI